MPITRAMNLARSAGSSKFSAFKKALGSSASSFKSTDSSSSSSHHRSEASSRTRNKQQVLSNASSTDMEDSYVEPPEVPVPPAGGLPRLTSLKIQSVMERKLDMVYNSQLGLYHTRTIRKVDRVVILVNDDRVPSPAGLWSTDLCVRKSNGGGGGIHQGKLGSMLPYMMKIREEKMGIIVLDNAGGSTSASLATVWSSILDRSDATHVFIVSYACGGNAVIELLNNHLDLVSRQLSGLAFIDSEYVLESHDVPYGTKKVLAQWASFYTKSEVDIGCRIKTMEKSKGCICVSLGNHSGKSVLNTAVPLVFAAFKARWSGFRVALKARGNEKACYICASAFTVTKWRRHCRTCQNAVCEPCSNVSEVRNASKTANVRLCRICHGLPSLVQWSRPRAVRAGKKESVLIHDGSADGRLGVFDFEMLSVIGKGACGKVLLVQKKSGAGAGQLYAMKVLRKAWVLDKDLVVQTMAERRILQEANHPFIVQLRFAFQNQDKLYMVMDYYSGGSLRHVLRKRTRFSIARATYYLSEVLLAIAHLHSQDIIYRDLKLENLVMDADGHVACTDFGLSKEDMSNESRTKTFVGTPEYLAPELIRKRGYGKGVDWWGLGILAFEMINGRAPFLAKTPQLLFQKIVTEQPVFTDKFSPEAVDLITKLTNKNPAKRLGCGKRGVEEIKEHPFFAEIDFDAVLNKTARNRPPAPHRADEVTDLYHIDRAVAKTREAREELMPDSPVAVAKSPRKNFDRFTYQGYDDWHPSMADDSIVGNDYEDDDTSTLSRDSDDDFSDF